MKRHRPVRPVREPGSAFAGFQFPSEVILLAVRWYLRYGLSYRDLEELLAERGIEVDHVTLYRWVQRFKPLLIDAARTGRARQSHAVRPQGWCSAVATVEPAPSCLPGSRAAPPYDLTCRS